jgi:hypothetical protein
MVLDTYITIDEKGIAGQDARTKEWYCKELPFKNDKDLDKKIAKINKVLNRHNKHLHKNNNGEKKEQIPKVKGLK